MIVERHVSPDGVLTFVVERLEDGQTLLGFEQSQWHTHPDLLVGQYGDTESTATSAYIDRLLRGTAVIGIRRREGAITEAWIMDDPAFEADAFAEGETLEMRHWDGRPWSPTQTGGDAREWDIYAEVSGGPELVRHFGQVPSFHDAGVLSLHLNRNGPSALRLHGWSNTGRLGADRALALDRHAIVTFTLEGLMDLQIDGFSIQNVIGGLILRRAPDRLERQGCLAFDPQPQDIEIELVPCYGLNGLIRARSVAITFEPGEPGGCDA
ncbi:immunity 50 family protein [Methylobacterium sp. J-078]|uniref:immunity 50 family protein n=1 Tax=Methylobacterium sp. J-078 TaxID=2836657 RepID=UPI001FB8D586|nr:immunity 50 family protein [Methylobacterium sp. J-078]MCJ2047852.1 immunity 50 family protein [Methylobacterium sp. J-078]